MRSDRGEQKDRLQSLRESLDELIERGARLSRRGVGAEIAPRYHVFALGFGFGGLLSLLRRRRKPVHAGLLSLPEDDRLAVPISDVARDRRWYRSHIESLTTSMGGATPMVEDVVPCPSPLHGRASAHQVRRTVHPVRVVRWRA